MSGGGALAGPGGVGERSCRHTAVPEVGGARGLRVSQNRALALSEGPRGTGQRL